MKVLATTLSICFCSILFGQIWFENFQGDIGQNAIIDNGATAWTTSCIGCNPSVGLSPDFHVDGNGFKWLDTDAEGTWLSETIDISTDIDVSISAKARADNSNDPQDYLIFEYSVDGGPFLTFTTNGSLNANFGNKTASVGPFNGNSVQIRIRGLSDDLADAIKIDNILVTGTSVLPVEFIRFDYLKLAENKFDFNWFVGSERENDFFTLSYSLDGQEFIEFENVYSKGNSNSEVEYLSSEKVLSQNKLYYIKLTQTDFNGEQTTLDVLTIDNRKNEEFFFTLSNAVLTLQFENKLQKSVQVSTIDGRILYTNPKSSEKEFQIDLKDLSHQIIIIQSIQDNKISRKKVYVQ